MGRKLYYVDSYGRVQRDRRAEKSRPGGPAPLMRMVWTVLILLTVMMVLASIHH